MPYAYNNNSTLRSAQMVSSLYASPTLYQATEWAEAVGVYQSAGGAWQSYVAIAGSYSTPAGVASLGQVPMAVAVGDLNHDGLDDVVYVEQSANIIGIAAGTSSGLDPISTVYATGGQPDGVTVGDFNGDGRDDVAVTHALSQTVGIYHQALDGALATPIYHNLSSGGFNDVDTGDLNSDGYADLVVLRGAGHNVDQVAILLQSNQGLGAPTYLTAVDGGYVPHGLAVGDVTGDGRDDIVVTAGGNLPDAHLNVFVQQATGTMATTPTTYPAYHIPEAVEIGDINHDGRNDIVTVHAGWQSLSTYLQNSSGALDPYVSDTIPYSDYYRPDALALADVTGDGGLDVVIANRHADLSQNGLVVLPNALSNQPVSTITAPALDTYFTSDVGAYLVTGTASHAASVEVSVDGGLTWVSVSVSGGSWSYNWAVPVGNGGYQILSRAIGSGGAVQSFPDEVQFSVDVMPPTQIALSGVTAMETPSIILYVAMIFMIVVTFRVMRSRRRGIVW